MIRGLYLICATAIWCPPIAKASDANDVNECIRLTSRNEVKACFAKIELQSEKDLDVATSRASSGADVRHTKLLSETTEAFKRYREAECNFEGDTMRGGFLAEDQADECFIIHNRQRVVDLDHATALTGH